MDNGVDRDGRSGDARSPVMAQDAHAAVLGVEMAIAQRILTTMEDVPPRSGLNAFGGEVHVERRPDLGGAVRRAAECAALAERVTLLTTLDAVAAARSELLALAAQRLPVVCHVATGYVGPAARGVFALGDLGWALVLASGVADAVDLALVARRAAEDSGTPFFVVHERAAHRRIEHVSTPDPRFCEAFLGAPHTRIRKLADPAHPSHAKTSDRAFAERVPFALGSAMRGLEGFTGRRHDSIERSGGDGATAMLIGAGVVGDVLLGEVDRLRAAGHDVGAVKLAALRPFPGPRLIRALARALVVTVLEPWDEPLAQSNPLTREVKSAFADALTWAPDYPGVGRLPRFHSGVVTGAPSDLAAGDVDAILENMARGELGKRLFVLGGEANLALPRKTEVAAGAPGRLSMRGVALDPVTANLCAELCANVALAGLALRCTAVVRPGDQPGDGAVFDLLAARERPRGTSAPHAQKLVVLEDRRLLHAGDPLAHLMAGGLVAVPTAEASGEGLLAELPAYVKALALDRGVRLLGYGVETSVPDEERRWMTAAAFSGVLLFAFGGGSRTALDGSLVEREVTQGLHALGAPAGLVPKGGKLARRAFEGHVEVERALVEGDVGAVSLGRRDARGGAVGG
jgi:pyruvate/2-oxoacid:ferredoxin oxidoreductase alpha subunit